MVLGLSKQDCLGSFPVLTKLLGGFLFFFKKGTAPAETVDQWVTPYKKQFLMTLGHRNLPITIQGMFRSKIQAQVERYQTTHVRYSGVRT